MRVGKEYRGKFCEVSWMDPGNGNARTRSGHDDLPRGRAALATWREYGVIDDVTDGVVRIVHSYGTDPERVQDRTDDVWCTWVPEVLIEQVRVFVPEAAP